MYVCIYIYIYISATPVLAKQAPAPKSRVQGLVSKLGREDLISNIKRTLSAWYLHSVGADKVGGIYSA